MSQLNLWKHVNNFPQHNPLTSFACLNPRGAKSSPHSPVRRRQTRSCTHLTMSRLTITSCLESPGVVLVSSRAVTERNVLQMRFARAGCHICGHYWWCRPHWLSSDCSDWECNTRFALGFFSPPRRCGGCLCWPACPCLSSLTTVVAGAGPRQRDQSCPRLRSVSVVNSATGTTHHTPRTTCSLHIWTHSTQHHAQLITLKLCQIWISYPSFTPVLNSQGSLNHNKRNLPVVNSQFSFDRSWGRELAVHQLLS